MLGHHFLAGGDDVAPGLQRALDVLMGGVLTAHRLDDDLAFGRERLLRVCCDDAWPKLEAAVFRGVADESLYQLQRRADAAFVRRRTLGEGARNASADCAQTEEDDADAGGRAHPAAYRVVRPAWSMTYLILSPLPVLRSISSTMVSASLFSVSHFW